MERLEVSDRAFDDELAVYPGSGQALGAPYVPTGDSVHRYYGGTAAANARANEDSWSEVTVLLGTSLRR